MFKTFVINLDIDKDRLQFMSQQLADLNITFERQSAINGNSCLDSLDDQVNQRNLLPNELGCALSHAEVYKKIVAGNIPYTLVFEDDVELPPNFKKVVTKMVGQQKKIGFEYLLFDYVPVGRPFIKHWLKSVKNHIKKRLENSILYAAAAILYATIKFLYIFPLALFEECRSKYKQNNPGPVKFYRPVYFAGAYLITLEGAKKLLSLAQPVIYTADQLPNKARALKGLHFYAYSPLIVRQKRRTFGSSILGLSGEEFTNLHKDVDYL